MNYRLHYQSCGLHQEPLNYICLHSSCSPHRLICAICRQERHDQSHHALPLKLYLSRKLHKLRCLAPSEFRIIATSLEKQKLAQAVSLDSLTTSIVARIEETKAEFNCFFDRQLESIERCAALINESEIDAGNLECIEQAARAVNSYEEYARNINQAIETVSSQISTLVISLHPEQVLIDHSWLGHPEIDIANTQLTSNNDDYKIAYLTKPLHKTCRTSFKVIKDTQKWVTVGICHADVVQHRNFGFRYHTIGHGVYAVSSNGGIWSHFRPDWNNKLGGLLFSQNETITVIYDANSQQVEFQVEGGAKLSLQIDPEEKGTLHFCVLLYFSGDELEIIHDLS